MKHITGGLVLSCITLLISLTLLAIEGGTIRQNEVADSLHAALKDSLANVMERRTYDISDDNELVADLTAQLMRQLNTNDKNLRLDVDIAGVDAKKGLLAVHVKEHFTYPNGRIGTAEDSACVVLEREKQRKIYRYAFTLSDRDAKRLHTEKDYRTFRITEGQPAKAPDKVYGLEVKSWRLKGSDTEMTPKEIRNTKVSSSAVYEAVLMDNSS